MAPLGILRWLLYNITFSLQSSTMLTPPLEPAHMRLLHIKSFQKLLNALDVSCTCGSTSERKFAGTPCTRSASSAQWRKQPVCSRSFTTRRASAFDIFGWFDNASALSSLMKNFPISADYISNPRYVLRINEWKFSVYRTVSSCRSEQERRSSRRLYIKTSVAVQKWTREFRIFNILMINSLQKTSAAKSAKTKTHETYEHVLKICKMLN